MRKAKFRSVDTQKKSWGPNNEKNTDISLDTQKVSGATKENIASNTSPNTKKWSGAIDEKRARDITLDTQEGGSTNEKKIRDIALDTQKWGAINEKKARDTSVVIPMGGDPLMKKARDIAFDTQNGAVTNEKKARDIAIDTQKWGATHEKKSRPISVFTQNWGAADEKIASAIPAANPKCEATNEKKTSAIPVVTPKDGGQFMKKGRDISGNTQKVTVSIMKKVKDISVKALMEPITKRARIISVVTQKGGVGKTATAINMSVGLHNLGYKVAAIDLDPQGQLAEGFGINRKSLKKTMFDVLLGMVQMKDIKQKAYGVDLYLSNRSLAELGVTVQASSNVEQYPDPYVLLKQALAQIDTKYDFIIIDTPPTVSIFNKNALNASTDAVIPMQPEGMAVKGAEDMLEFIREVQKSTNKKLNVLGILATMVQNTNLHNTIMQDIRKSFIETDVTVFDTIIKRTIRYGSAQTDGVPDTKNFPEYTEFLKEALFSETA